MIKTLKKNFPNIYILVVAIAIAMWFDGINSILHAFLPQNYKTGIVLCTVALLVFYLDDGNLSELYNYNPNKDKLIRHAPAAMASANFD